MKQKTKEEAFASQTGLIPSLLFLCAIGLAIAAIFSPWFLWREPPNWLMEEQISTTDLVYLLPYVTSRGNDTIVGAQTNDSNLALGVGNAARLIILGITTLSFCLLLRNRSQRYR